MKTAIVHDYLNQWGGAERVVQAICELFPGAPIYTTICTPEIKAKFPGNPIHTSFMQKFPGVLNHHQPYLPFYPAAIESFDLSEYDLVISSSSAWGKGAITRSDALHICYCHNPMRFAWQSEDYARRERLGRFSKIILPLILNYVRLWDVSSALRPDYYLANSRTVAQRIRRYWNRDSTVINPPVNVEQIPFSTTPRQDFYLTVGRMIPYKRLDITVEAFRLLDKPLKVVGTGRDLETLKKLAGPKTEFLGKVSDRELYRLYGQCRAFIQAGAEDFGITLIEAMAGGTPIIGIRRYGPAETIIEGENGLFFEEQTPQAVVRAVQQFEERQGDFDPLRIRKYAESFNHARFLKELSDFITQKIGDHFGLSTLEPELV